MLRALLAHPQVVLHKRHLVYCLRVVSVGCTRTGVERISKVWGSVTFFYPKIIRATKETLGSPDLVPAEAEYSG
jgi:hypothetical protein